MRPTFKYSIGIMTILLVVLGTDCRKGKIGEKHPNKPPDTKLANVPLENDSLHSYTKGDSLSVYLPLQTLSWDGDDEDGFVVKYRYRYRTVHVTRGDTYYFPARDAWIETTATQVEIPFESSDADRVVDGDTIASNLQIFEVAAIDNEGAVDPTPAVKRFWTFANKLPETYILYPADGDSLLVRANTTPTWRGVLVSWQGEDPDGEVRDYRWRVDSLEWSPWTRDTSVYINPVAFRGPLDGWHVIEVMARDNLYIQDTTPAKIHVRLVEVKFDRPLLVVYEEQSAEPGGEPSNTEDFYISLFDSVVGVGNYDMINFRTYTGSFIDTVAHYRVIFWYRDKMMGSRSYRFWTARNGEIKSIISQYLDLGGNLWISGWSAVYGVEEAQFDSGGFGFDYMHIEEVEEISEPQFIGGEGHEGCPTVMVDTSRLPGVPWRWDGVACVYGLTGRAFTLPLLTYVPRSDTTLVGKVVCTYYDGVTYKVVTTTFPLLYLYEEDARELVRYILTKMNIL